MKFADGVRVLITINLFNATLFYSPGMRTTGEQNVSICFL